MKMAPRSPATRGRSSANQPISATSSATSHGRHRRSTGLSGVRSMARSGGGVEGPARGHSVPTVGVLRKAGTLHAYHAEALAGGRLHHDPTFQLIRHCGTQLLQPGHFGRDVIGLDVYVNATLVAHTLNLHQGLVRLRLQHAVIAAGSR